MLTDRKSPTRRGAAALGVAAGAAGVLVPMTAGPAGAADDPGCTKDDGEIVEQTPIDAEGPITGEVGLLTLWFSPSTECVWSTAHTHPWIEGHGPIMAKLFKENNGARVGWNNPTWPDKAATDAWYVGRDTEFTGYGRVDDDTSMHYFDAWTATYVLQG